MYVYKYVCVSLTLYDTHNKTYVCIMYMYCMCMYINPYVCIHVVYSEMMW